MRFSACRRRLLWGSLLLTLACTTACHFARSQRTASNSASPPGDTSSPTRPSGDARKDFHEALERLNTAYPYRLTEESSSIGDGREIPGGTRTVEFAAADRSHTKWTNGPLGGTEVITIGDKQYGKLNNGNWFVGSPTGLAQRQIMEKRMRELMASAVKDVRYVGTDTINGVPCHTYIYTMDINVSDQRWIGTGKAWIGTGDGLPHKLDSDLRIGSYTQKSLITYEYNVDFKVEKPVM